ncbi:MAG: nucleotide sugar dehydrogenase [Xanthomonadales bacterium]|jgi:UDP-N-acetyl-D-galactosamine dehydrogenase|nr:nucleotide sugar dehydrogenase [Xanthomonadales bacterium]
MTSPTIAIIGLGYVGTPLLAAFAEVGPVIGFDLDAGRIAELQAGRDRTGELDARERERVAGVPLTADPAGMAEATVYIVTVPTPVLEDHTPDLRPLEQASETLGPLLKAGDTVIFESTVYPGATEEVCVPILARLSGLEPKNDFWYGYSPERINPGDRERRLQGIVKVTSGCCPTSAAFIDGLYAKIIPAGTHRASSVRVAEAAKVIENTQRDVNIALVNELAMLFDRLGLDTREVLEAAGTKWNFLPFRPGLVGGHCIGVDPYYLTHKAQEVGFDPNIILAGRGVNDAMAGWVAQRVLAHMQDAEIAAEGARVLVLGLTFKENCPDTRNSQVFRLVGELQAAGCAVDVHDPWVEEAGARGLSLVEAPQAGAYDVVVLAVAHDAFQERGVAELKGLGREGAVVYDVKGLFEATEVAGRL